MKKPASYKIDVEILKQFKVKCVLAEVSPSALVETLMRRFLDTDNHTEILAQAQTLKPKRE